MLINDKKISKSLINDLMLYLKENKNSLFYLNRSITHDLDCWINEDYKFVLEYLKKYLHNNRRATKDCLKPKGKVFIILSYNEPIIMSVVPVLNALMAGNDVTLKPSQKNVGFVKNIWVDSGLVSKYNLKLKILENFSYDNLDEYIKFSKVVYFFGSYEKAKIVSLACARNFIQFIPELEAVDSKVVKINRIGKFDIESDVLNTLSQSFSHSGQSCQRIHGVLVEKRLFNEYSDMLIQLFNKNIDNNCSSGCSQSTDNVTEHFLDDVKKINSETIYSNCNKAPFLVINPPKDCEFIKNAYFFPTLWVVPYENEDEVLKILNNRKFYLGLNIVSDDKKFVDKIIKNTNFSRYTINSRHIEIRNFEGWGGNWPTGYNGYRSWLYHFSNQYIEIR